MTPKGMIAQPAGLIAIDGVSLSPLGDRSSVYG
jgi:hypothetical protein